MGKSGGGAGGGGGFGFAQIGIQAFQALLGASSAMSAGSAATEQANREVAEYERQKEEERLNARSEKSDRARQADRETASMIAAMADSGGLGTTSSRFAGSIGFIAGVDMARIEGNSISRINALSSRQVAAQQKAANARTRATGAAFSSLLTGAGNVLGTVADQREKQRQQEQQKQTGTSKVA
jgi:hypothetical protein